MATILELRQQLAAAEKALALEGELAVLRHNDPVYNFKPLVFHAEGGLTAWSNARDYLLMHTAEARTETEAEWEHGDWLEMLFECGWLIEEAQMGPELIQRM
jgi:hypothetical protein